MTHSRGTIRFFCSNCIAPLEARRRQAGARMRCPWCQTVLVVPQESRPDAPAEMYALAEGTAPGPGPEAESGFYVTCLVCRTRMHATADQVGRVVVCPDCGTSTVVTGPSRGPTPPPAAPAPLEPAEIYEVSKEEGQPLPTDSEVYRLYIPVVCSLCHTRMHATEEQAGQTVVCPDCGSRNVVPQPGEALGSQASVPEPQDGYRLAEPSPEPGQARPSGPKLYVYKCPTCHTRLHATPAEAGRATACPDCSTEFTIPPPPAEWKWDPFEQKAEVYDLAGPLPVASAEEGKVPPAPRPEPRPSRSIEQEVEERRNLLPKRTRPQLPDWPFLQGIWTFPWYRTSRGCWLGLSAGALVLWYLVREALALAAIGEGRALFLAIMYGGFALVAGAIYLVWAGLALNMILMETANGADSVDDWATGEVFDRMFDALPFVNSLALSALVAWVIEKGAPGVPFGVGFAAVGFVLFPVFVLSMLETGSVFVPVSLKIVGSLFRNGSGWVRFYFFSGAMLAALAALALGLYPLLGAATACAVAPLAAAATMIYSRLLGRLGWYCIERSRGRSTSSEE